MQSVTALQQSPYLSKKIDSYGKVFSNIYGQFFFRVTVFKYTKALGPNSKLLNPEVLQVHDSQLKHINNQGNYLI